MATRKVAAFLVLVIAPVAVWCLFVAGGRWAGEDGKEEAAACSGRFPENVFPEKPSIKPICERGKSAGSDRPENPGGSSGSEQGNEPTTNVQELPKRENPGSDATGDLKFTCDGGTVSRLMCLRAPAERRWHGANPAYAGGGNNPTRLVHGVVYLRQVQSEPPIPAVGAMVWDWGQHHRTFTDVAGRFEFEADCTVNSDGTTESWHCKLYAGFMGYSLDAPVGGRSYRDSDFQTAGGVALFLRKRQDVTIRLEFVNPAVARDGVSVLIGTGVRSSGTIADDAAHYLFVDAPWCKTLTIRGPNIGFVIMGVNGRACRAASKGIEPIWDDIGQPMSTETAVYRITLESCDNYQVTGTVADMRSREPLYCALIAGRGDGEVTVSDEDGRFSLWISRNPRSGENFDSTESQFLQVSFPCFSTLRRSADPMQPMDQSFGIAMVGPGGSAEGPWDIRLRPLVDATLSLVVEGLETAGGCQLLLPCANVDENRRLAAPQRVPASGRLSLRNFPWGVESAVISGPGLQPGRVTLQELNDWSGGGPYQIEARRAPK